MDLHSKCAKIKAVVMDIDGVLTDGRIGYSVTNDEVKFFHVRDGHALRMAAREGLKIGCLSGRRSLANEIRAKELQMDFLYQGCHNKKDGFLKLLEEQHLAPEECLYIGDDLVDMPPMRLAGVAVAVGDGVEELDQVCDFRTRAFGGQGAVREAVERLMKEQGIWEKALERYQS